MAATYGLPRFRALCRQKSLVKKVLYRTRLLTLFAALGGVGLHAWAADFSFSGYGTLGYAKSDKPFGYQRFIDDDGTLKRDTVFGAQLDARFENQIGATVQLKAAPSLSSDSKYDATVAWAFLSYRPSNDWLLRAGKLRIPLYLNSETTDIGATFDFARLPTEMYSISPTTDLNGASFRKNWTQDLGEWVLDGFWGKANIDQRSFSRDGVVIPRGPSFEPIKITASGFALSLRRDEGSYRLGFNQAVARRANGQPITNRVLFQPIDASLPGAGVYLLQGPGVQVSDSTNNTAITIGADVSVGAGVRVVGEFARRIVRSDIGPDTTGGYVSVLKRISNWTVYGTYAHLRSTSGPLNNYTLVNENRVPEFIPNSKFINAGQRAQADYIQAFDQNSWAVGGSYSLTRTSKIKAELQRVHVGQVSFMVDALAGTTVRQQNFNVYSLSYSFAF